MIVRAMSWQSVSSLSQEPVPDDVREPTLHTGRRMTFTNGDGSRLRYLIVHRVICDHSSVDGEDHEEHPHSAEYLDIPRLFPHDTRASALRGQNVVPDASVESFWEDKPIVVTRNYICETYHSQIKKSFEAITLGAETQITSRLRPWIYQLKAAGPEAQHLSESIRISAMLSTALEEYMLFAHPQMGEWNEQQDLKAPYDYFYHFRHKLREVSQAQIGQFEKQELNILLDYIDSTQGATFDEIDRKFKSGQVDRSSFTKLFAPNEVVITIQDGYPRAHIAERTMPSTRDRAIDLQCWTWLFDGSFRKKTERITVSWPTTNPSVVKIRNLAAWPLRLDNSGLRERLLQRGKRFWSCRIRKLVSYASPTPTIFELQITNPKYMIDYRTYRQIHPNAFASPLLDEAEMLEQGIDINSAGPPDDLFSILLPGTMIGYAFHDKKWRSLSIDHIGPVPWNKDAFSRLVLKSQKKDTIKALVSVHLTTVQDMDVVENKGNGLIILLHGSPGTGKTLTAESVAEIAEKPLYRVTCGDVGTTAENVERYLESVLLIGSIWGCVVLLDEADVFLEERQVTDLSRNALVSVFLRVLEYYDGILILTTNRVGTFDEAFKSRVQLAVHYPVLDESGRDEIWGNFLDILKEKNVDMDYDELKRKVRTLARIPFNGRQIRNNLWTAAQVAKYKQERLSYSHLEQVVEISREFDEYLEKTHGQTDEDNAKMQGTRHA